MMGSATDSQRRWPVRRLTFVGVLVLLVAIVAWPRGPGISVSRETSYLVEPIDEHGYVDYRAALQPKSMIPPEENAAGPYLMAVADTKRENYSESEWIELCTKLGVPPAVDPAVKTYARDGFTPSSWEGRDEAWQDEAASRLYDEMIDAASRAWTDDEFPDVAEWLELNARALEWIESGADRPRFQFPIERQDRRLVPYEVPATDRRFFARLLTVRSMNHLGHSRLSLAEQDVDRLFRLATHANEPASYVDQFVSGVIFSMAAGKEIELIGDLKSQSDVQRRRDRLNSEAVLPGYVDTLMRVERLEMLQVLQDIDRERRGLLPRGLAVVSDGRLKITGWRREWQLRRIDTEYCSREVNRIFDAGERAMSLEVAERNEALKKIDLELKSMRLPAGKSLDTPWLSGNEVNRGIVTGMLPEFGLLQDTYRRALAKIKLLDVLCAARLYEIESGRGPSSPEDLVPEFLEEWPTDDLVGEPFGEAVVDDSWVIWHCSEQSLAERPEEVESWRSIRIPLKRGLDSQD